MAGDSVPLAPPPTGWTVADIDALPDTGVRYELVDGVPRIMTPPKLSTSRPGAGWPTCSSRRRRRIWWSPSRSG